MYTRKSPRGRTRESQKDACKDKPKNSRIFRDRPTSRAHASTDANSLIKTRRNARAENVRLPPNLANASSAFWLSTTASLTPAGRSCNSAGLDGAFLPAALAASFSLSTTARKRSAAFRLNDLCDRVRSRTLARAHTALELARHVAITNRASSTCARETTRLSPVRVARRRRGRTRARAEVRRPSVRRVRRRGGAVCGDIARARARGGRG